MPATTIHTLAKLYESQQYEALITQGEALVAQPPNDYLLANILGAAYAALGRTEQAQAHYRAAITIKPNFVDAYSNLGALLDGIGQHERAIATYQQALAINPQHAASHHNLALALSHSGNHTAALSSYQAALRIDTNYADARANLARSLQALGRAEAAAKAYDSALLLQPTNAQWHFNLANLHQTMGRLKPAMLGYKNVLKLWPKHAESYYNLGLILKLQGNLPAAQRALAKALACKPNYIFAHYSMGNTLNSMGQYPQAIASYQQALELAPDYDAARAKKYYLQAHICDWQSMAADDAAAEHKLAQLGTRGLVSPFDLLSLDDSPPRHLQRAKIFAARAYPQSALPAIAPPAQQPKRLRVGYFSADFHNHATLYLMAGLFEHHNKQQFEIFAYSFGPNKRDAMRERLVAAVDTFRDVAKHSDKDIAQLARNDGIDIAIDLKGYTEAARMGIFAYRAAPIQVSYLGHPGPTGAAFIDYVLADTTVIPANHKRYYNEKVGYLPHSYQVNDNQRAIAVQTPSRAQLGLPEQGFVFCCFNNNYKIAAAEFAIWMRLLHQTQGSVLWLFKANAWAEANLRAAAAAHGINPARLVFAPRLPQAEHLARQRQADLFLDTFIYNAHTTASDALWAGLPVLTKQGKSFAARVAASLLNALALPELITHSSADYEAKALELARSPAKLSALKQQLAAHRDSAPLFDTPRFTAHIEQAYHTMYARYFAGKAPQGFTIKPH